MDCITWIYPKRNNHSFVKTLEDLYESYSIYRTIIVCRNKYYMKRLYFELMSNGISVLKLQSFWDLEHFHQSNYRVMIITFDQIYQYPDLIKEYAFEQDYLWMLHEMSSLQEQYCISHMREVDNINYYVYIN